MTRKDYAVLFLLSLIVITTAGYLQKSAGYMDAEYYAVTGRGLLSGKGFTQDFLWNYLDDPSGIPHPSNTYWMPLASIFSAISVSYKQGDQFATLWVVFIIISSFVPLLTARAAFSFTSRRSDGWMAGLLALFSGFYLLYYALPETFTLGMILGFIMISNLARIISVREFNNQWILTWGIIGIISGLLHLSRAEGLLWFFLALGCLLFTATKVRKAGILLPALLLLIGGYLLVSGAWFARNIEYWGFPFPPGTNRTLWLEYYDQTFLFPADSLTFQNWIQSGINSISRARLDAFWMNIKSAIAVQGGILLVPLIISGWWFKRTDKRLVLAGIYYVIIFLLMTVVFPFAGSRGGYIHSAAGVQILFWALVPVGLDKFIQWGNRKRGWQMEQARFVFQIGIISIMFFMSGIVFFQRVIATTNGVSNWLIDENKYANVQKELDRMGHLDGESLVMIKNPPGWNLITNSPAVVIPDGGITSIRLAAKIFSATILIIDKDHPKALKNFFEGRENSPEMELILTMEDIKVYRLLQLP
jgi:hypothetical protein